MPKVTSPTETLLVTQQGEPVPQYWDTLLLQYDKITGANGSVFTTPGKANTIDNLATNYKYISTASTNAVNVTNYPDKIFSIIASNASASNKFLKLYNKDTAPVIGTDVPKATYMIPANQTLQLANFTLGMYFSFGISFVITGGMADSDSTVTAANDVVVNLIFR